MFAMLKKMDYVQATEHPISICIVSCEICRNYGVKGCTVYKKLFSTSTHPTRERDWNAVMRRGETQGNSCFCDVEKVMMIDEVLQYSLVV